MIQASAPGVPLAEKNMTLLADLELVTQELIARQDELATLYELTQAMRHRLEVAEVLQSVLAQVGRLFKAEIAFALWEGPDGELRLYQQPGAALDAEEAGRWYARLRVGQRDLMWNPPQTPQPLLLTPLRVRATMAGALGVVGATDDTFSFPERKLLRVIAEQTGAHLENVRLHEEIVAQARLQSELALARQVQMRLLPGTVPGVPGLQLAAAARPAREVGGDFYDFTRRGDDLILTLGDVSGKGMSAALLMGITRTTFRNAVEFAPHATPAEIVAQANQFLYGDFTDVSMFATVFAARYQPAQRRLAYANAGHAPVIFCPTGGRARLLEADGTALGVLPDCFSDDHSLTIQPGDFLLIASDGLMDARDASGMLYGIDRLLGLVEELAGRAHDSAEYSAQQLLATLAAFSPEDQQDDDQTLIVLRGVA